MAIVLALEDIGECAHKRWGVLSRIPSTFVTLASAFPAYVLAAVWPFLSAAPAHAAPAVPTVFTLEIVSRTRNVTDVVQATDGTLWFIADGRVCGFDGSSAPSCLAGPMRPRQLLASPDGGVIVGSEHPTSFSSLLDSANMTALESNPALKGLRITDLCWWNGMPWAATGSRLLPMLGKDARTPAIQTAGEDIVAVAANPTGPLYIATQHRLLRLDSPDATATPVRSDDVEGHAVTALALDGKGDVWVGTTLGLWHNGRIIAQNLQIEAAFSSRSLDAVLVDVEGSVWVAAAPGLAQLRVNPAIRVFAAADGLGGEMPFTVMPLRTTMCGWCKI